jgi:ATP-dependent DNA helicase RecG
MLAAEKQSLLLIAIMIAVDNGFQTAFMCPTEILAEQHYKTITDFIAKINDAREGTDKEKIKVSILIGGQKKKLRGEILEDIQIRQI